MDLKKRVVTVVGLQKSGVAALDLALKLGAEVRVTDYRSSELIDDRYINWIKQNNICAEFGAHTKEFISSSDIVVISPGVRQTSQPVVWANDLNIPVLGEIEFAFQFCKKPVISITGSNGKTTVSTFISEVLNLSGYKAYLCGNIGDPFCQYVLDDCDYFVVEVSSFQTESIHDNNCKYNYNGLNIKGFKPSISVFLNFSQNHLDRHKDIDEYFNAKERVFVNQNKNDFAVLNYSDNKVRNVADRINSKVQYFCEQLSDINPNYSAVEAIAEIVGVDADTCRGVFNSFKGVEHRMEVVANIDGVEYVNDAKSTTAQATIWAIDLIKKPIVLICGGKDKNIDYSVVSASLKGKVKKVLVIGQAASKIFKAFHQIVEVEEFSSLDEAVNAARIFAVEGDCVLLSPMCASFDMFDNFEHRGRVFKDVVGELALNQLL